MKNLYFIRHGQSEANIAGICSGVLDSPLTDTGVQQAIKAGLEARQNGIKLDVILSSPLKRAFNTAEKVAHELNYNKNMIEKHDILIERNFGILEGRNMEAETGVSLDYYYTNPLSIDRVEGVETMKDLHTRAKHVLDYVRSRPEETILLVSHGALARSILKILKDVSFDAAIEPLNNAEIIQLI